MNNTPEINLTLDPFGTAEAAQIAEAAEGATEEKTAAIEELAESHLSDATCAPPSPGILCKTASAWCICPGGRMPPS